MLLKIPLPLYLRYVVLNVKATGIGFRCFVTFLHYKSPLIKGVFWKIKKKLHVAIVSGVISFSVLFFQAFFLEQNSQAYLFLAWTAEDRRETLFFPFLETGRKSEGKMGTDRHKAGTEIVTAVMIGNDSMVRKLNVYIWQFPKRTFLCTHNERTNWFLVHCVSRPGRSIVRLTTFFLTIDLTGRETQCIRHQLVLSLWLWRLSSVSTTEDWALFVRKTFIFLHTYKENLLAAVVRFAR